MCLCVFSVARPTAAAVNRAHRRQAHIQPGRASAEHTCFPMPSIDLYALLCSVCVCIPSFSAFNLCRYISVSERLKLKHTLQGKLAHAFLPLYFSAFQCPLPDDAHVAASPLSLSFTFITCRYLSYSADRLSFTVASNFDQQLLNAGGCPLHQ